MTRAKISKSSVMPLKPDVEALKQVAKESGFDRSTGNNQSRGGESAAPAAVSAVETAEVPQRGRRKRRVARSENLSHRVTPQTITNLNTIADALSEEQNRDVPLVDALEYAVANAAKPLRDAPGE